MNANFSSDNWTSNHPIKVYLLIGLLYVDVVFWPLIWTGLLVYALYYSLWWMQRPEDEVEIYDAWGLNEEEEEQGNSGRDGMGLMLERHRAIKAQMRGEAPNEPGRQGGSMMMMMRIRLSRANSVLVALLSEREMPETEEYLLADLPRSNQASSGNGLPAPVVASRSGR
ncbi:hypothetical protein SUNI508_04873 [Seiridium unicorne]|uniref:Uncharacterized protein n=1 Tax=Seiridium unicorne TaxID=138068 RepID=A0ABR2V5K6_9PEZI